MCEASPSTMHPISPTSRLNASPRTPPGNSSSSLAIAPGKPDTRAIPSPASITRPSSPRSTDGVQLSTCLRRASAMSFESNLSASTAIRSHAPCQVPLRLGQPARERAVEHLVAHPGDHPADHGGVHVDLQFHGMARGPLERFGEQRLLRIAQRDGHPYL